MLAIAVIVISVVAAAWPFHDLLKNGTQNFGTKFETFFADDKNSYGNTPPPR